MSSPENTPGSCSAVDEALEHLERVEQELKTRARYAKEIGAAHADPNWPLGSA